MVEPTNVSNDSSIECQVGTLLVVDGHSLAFRAFFAMPVDKFSNSDGQATNAVWGFITMLSQVINSVHPDRLAIAFDVKGGTFRNQLLSQYKGTRDAAPSELLSQLPLIQRLLTALGVRYIEQQGYEGDDIIASLATMGARDNYRVLVLSGDRDAFQLIDDHINVLYPGRHFSDLQLMDAQAVVEKYSVTPQQYADLAALRGEQSDNIPGVPGVGDGYAAKWLNAYGSLEGVLEHAGEIKGKKGESLRECIEQVRLNRKVNALVRDLDLNITLDDLRFGTIHVDALGELLAQLEFGVTKKRSIVRTFSKDTATVDSDIKRILAAVKPSVRRESKPASTSNVEHDEQTSQVLDMLDEEELTALMQSVRVRHLRSLHDAKDWASYVRGELDTLISDTTTSVSGTIRSSLTCSEDVRNEHMLIVHAIGSDMPLGQTFSFPAHSVTMMLKHEIAILDLSLLGDDAQQIHHCIASLLEDCMPWCVMHNAKQQLARLHTAHLVNEIQALPVMLFDTALAAYLTDPDTRSETLEDTAMHFLDIDMTQEMCEVQQGELDLGISLDDAQTEQKDEHEEEKMVKQVVLIRLLLRYFAPLLDSRHQTGLIRDLELPVSVLLRRMEDVGAAVDMQRLIDMRDQFASDAQFAQSIAWRAAGREINLQSPKQIQQVLFEDLQLQPTRRTKRGSYTTNAEALQNLYVKLDPEEKASQFLGALLKHRETNKLKQIVQSLIDADRYHDARIHTTYEQTAASTGRLSSTDPNLQNIPNRNAIGREIRSVFIPGEGYESLMSCDYSQVELRIMAHLSQDQALIQAFKSGADFHRYVAGLVYHIPVEQVTADQRTHVKAMSYGLAYGLSTYGLAKQLGITAREAQQLKMEYFQTFGNVHEYLESLVACARDQGYTQTMFGRRRYFPHLDSANRVLRDAAERAALNAPIQGSAADIMKLAMIRVDQALRSEHLRSRVILQIHDELILEIATGECETVENVVKHAMEHAVELSVPLDVSTGVGTDWQLAAH